jgi:hypothetical protein
MSDRGIGVRFLAEAVILLFPFVSRTVLGHSASSPANTWSSFATREWHRMLRMHGSRTPILHTSPWLVLIHVYHRVTLAFQSGQIYEICWFKDTFVLFKLSRVLDQCLDHGFPSCDPQAACGPPGCILRPAATLINCIHTTNILK